MDYLEKEFAEYKEGRKKGLSFEAINPWKAHSMQSLYQQLRPFISHKGKVLEVGSGSGYLLSLFPKQYNITGIDNHPQSLTYSKRLFRDKQRKGNFIKASAFKLPFKKDSFDLVISVGMIEHYKRKQQLTILKEMKRVSKKLVLLSIPNKHKESLYQLWRKESPNYTVEEENLYSLKELGKQTGLKTIKESGFHTLAWKGSYGKKTQQRLRKNGLVLKDKLYKKDLKKTVKRELKRKESFLKNYSFLRYALYTKA